MTRIGCGNIRNDLRITASHLRARNDLRITASHLRARNDLRITLSHLRDLGSKGVTFTAANLLAAPTAFTGRHLHQVAGAPRVRLCFTFVRENAPRYQQERRVIIERFARIPAKLRQRFEAQCPRLTVDLVSKHIQPQRGAAASLGKSPGARPETSSSTCRTV
ncbi:MAG: hypothetical protein ACOY0T_03360 [Myxococcota bacterium]